MLQEYARMLKLERMMKEYRKNVERMLTECFGTTATATVVFTVAGSLHGQPAARHPHTRRPHKNYAMCNVR